MSVLLYEPGLVALLDSPFGPVARNVTVKAERVAELARQNVQAQFNTRTGNLQNSIGVFPDETADGLAFEVGTEQGSEPHQILPVAAPVLVSPPGHPDPLDQPRRLVNHPGFGPKPWLQPALEAVFTGG